MPIVKKCDILKQYCQFIEIVEQNYRRLSPKKSFKKAIEIAMEQGILTDYLDRKSREVINMLCAKYSYKDDIAVKQREAREEGIQQGAQQNAIETAKKMLQDKLSIDKTSQYSDLSRETVLELQKEINSKS